MNASPFATTRLLFARHGQTEANLDDIFSGVTEVALTPLGHTQAQQLAERLRIERIDAIYCSPLQRALATATPTAITLNLELQIRDELREMNFGQWEGRRRAHFAPEYPDELALWERGSWLARPPGGESQQEVIARATRCMAELLANHTGQTIFIVAHRTLLRLLIGHMLDMALPASRALPLYTASLSELRMNNGQAQLVYYNDTSHLSPDNP